MKTNTKTAKKAVQDLNEQQLQEKLQAIKIENEREGLKEIQAILEKRNLVIVTQVPIHINGQPVGVVVKSK